MEEIAEGGNVRGENESNVNVLATRKKELR